jgi:hypothetical protein
MTSIDYLSIAKQYFPEESIWEFHSNSGFMVKGSYFFPNKCYQFLFQYENNIVSAAHHLSIEPGYMHCVYPSPRDSNLCANTLNDYIQIYKPSKESFIKMINMTLYNIKTTKLKLKLKRIDNDFT